MIGWSVLGGGWISFRVPPPGGLRHDLGTRHQTSQVHGARRYRGDVLDGYAEVRAPLLHRSIYAVTA